MTFWLCGFFLGALLVIGGWRVLQQGRERMARQAWMSIALGLLVCLVALTGMAGTGSSPGPTTMTPASKLATARRLTPSLASRCDRHRPDNSQADLPVPGRS